MTLTIREYITTRGECPFRTWLDGPDTRTRARIQARVLRFETGNLGDRKVVVGGVDEARCQFGPGYRIYFARAATTFTLLLVGGDKASQRRDIREARRFLAEYLEATHHGTT